jgi:hypothetical protein
MVSRGASSIFNEARHYKREAYITAISKAVHYDRIALVLPSTDPNRILNYWLQEGILTLPTIFFSRSCDDGSLDTEHSGMAALAPL